jgi:hypothetical protein
MQKKTRALIHITWSLVFERSFDGVSVHDLTNGGEVLANTVE